MNSHEDLPRFVIESLPAPSFFKHHPYSAAVQEYWSTKAAPRFSLLDHLSPQGCAQELTAALHAIDDELSALQMVMCAMRTKRNDFSLIGRLPPEILSHIFSFHAIQNQPNPPGLGWITVTHVCRRWRQVALADPGLWSTVVFDLGAEWAEEMLARSKAALISYCRDLSYQRLSRRTRSLDDEVTLGEHLPHVRRLVLSGDTDSLAPALRALTTPAPHLESLELLRNEPRLYELRVALPSDLFARDAPKLRRVTLCSFAVPWDDSPLSFFGLTHLDIRIRLPPTVPFPSSASAVHRDLLSIPTLEQLLSMLEAMPALQELTLGNCLPPAGSTASRVVPLRHMSKLSLDGLLPQIVAVLERVSLPSSASLSLRCPDHNLLDRLLDTLISILASHFQAPETPIPPLSTMVIDAADAVRSLTIMVWDTDEIPLHRPRFKPSSPARLHLAFSSRYNTLESLALQICKALPLRDLQSLSITYPKAAWSAADWVDVCNHCPNVAHLLVGVSWALTLFPTLRQRNDAFPSLVTLELHNIYFSFTPPPEYTEAVGDALLVILRARSNAGIPVRHVTLRSCSPTRWIKLLSEVVNVICDPDPDTASESDSQSSSAFEHDYDYDSWSSDHDSDDSDQFE